MSPTGTPDCPTLLLINYYFAYSLIKSKILTYYWFLFFFFVFFLFLCLFFLFFLIFCNCVFCPIFCVFYVSFSSTFISFFISFISFSISFTLFLLFTAFIVSPHSGHLNWYSTATSKGVVMHLFLQENIA